MGCSGCRKARVAFKTQIQKLSQPGVPKPQQEVKSNIPVVFVVKTRRQLRIEARNARIVARNARKLLAQQNQSPIPKESK